MCLLRVKNETARPREGDGRTAEVPLGRAESGAAGAGIRLPARARGLHHDLSLGVLHLGLAAADGGHPGSAVRNHFGVHEHAAAVTAPGRAPEVPEGEPRAVNRAHLFQTRLRDCFRRHVILLSLGPLSGPSGRV